MRWNVGGLLRLAALIHPSIASFKNTVPGVSFHHCRVGRNDRTCLGEVERGLGKTRPPSAVASPLESLSFEEMAEYTAMDARPSQNHPVTTAIIGKRRTTDVTVY